MQDLLSKGEKFAVNNLRLNFTEEGKFPYLMGILFRVSYLGLDVWPYCSLDASDSQCEDSDLLA